VKPPPRFSGLTPKSTRASAAARGASKKADTKPELALRAAIWRRGYRFRTNRTDLPGCPDIVFAGPRVAVFVDGDFWHGNNWIARKEKLVHGHNPRYWVAKIESNMARDAVQSQQLRDQGWRVIRVWESQIVRDPGRVIQCIERALRFAQSPKPRKI
jgi:DNA mismatch endonuclease, patch repair protein